MTTYPQPSDPVSALTRADATTEAHSDDHGRVIGIWENVKHHGAVGDGVTDDSTAIQAAIDTALGGTMSATVPTPTRYGYDGTAVVYLPAGIYRITTPLIIRGAQGLTFMGAGTQATIISVYGTLTQAIYLQGVSHCRLEGFQIQGHGGYGSATSEVTYGINWEWDSSLTVGSSSRCVFSNIWITDLDYVYGFGIGDNSVNLDVSHGQFYHVNVSGNMTPNDGEATHWQAGFLVGNGTQGNILNHHFVDSTLIGLRYGWKVEFVNNVGIHYGGSSNVETLVHVTGSNNVTLEGFRAEECKYLVGSGGGASYASNLSVRDVTYTNSTDLTSGVSGRFFQWNYTGHVLIENLRTYMPAASTRLRLYSVTTTGRPVYWTVRGAWMTDLTTLSDILEVGNASTPAIVDTMGVVGVASDTQAVTTLFPPEVVSYNTSEVSTSRQIAHNVEINGYLDHDGTTVGFYGVTPATRPTAYTQTYSTADKTHAAPTAAALTVADGAGTNDGTIGAITADASVIAAVQELAAQVNKLVADDADTKQVVNSIIDDLQTLGLLQ